MVIQSGTGLCATQMITHINIKRWSDGERKYLPNITIIIDFSYKKFLICKNVSAPIEHAALPPHIYIYLVAGRMYSRGASKDSGTEKYLSCIFIWAAESEANTIKCILYTSIR